MINNILNFKFDNQSIYINIKTNNTTQFMVNADLLCCTLVRRRQYMRV